MAAIFNVHFEAYRIIVQLGNVFFQIQGVKIRKDDYYVTCFY